MAWLWVLLAVLASFAAALAFRFALPWSGWRRSIAWLFASFAAALAPCLVPLSALPWRFAATLVAVAILVKLYDLFMQPSRGQDLTRRSYVLYLMNWFWLVLRREPPRVPAAHDRKQLSRTTPIALVMAGLCVVVFSVDYVDVPFAIEHSVKTSILMTTIVPWANGAARIWRLLGGLALDPMFNPAMARTPADFWRRWNRPAQQFLHEYAFRPSGGAHRPICGTLLTFAASGLVHEYVFGIAAGRFQGWQFLFFGVQGLAVVATCRVRPRGWLVLPCVGATIVFNVVSAMLFFKSVNCVLPFYTPRVH